MQPTDYERVSQVALVRTAAGLRQARRSVSGGGSRRLRKSCYADRHNSLGYMIP